jgi:uncharacterized protein (TIGR00297 family)
MQLLYGFLLAGLIAWAAWRAHALSRSGTWAAIVTGGLIFGLGGLPWAALLLVFFVSSSGLSRLFAVRKAGLNEKFSKGSQRDWGQVLANGGLGALLALSLFWLPGNAWLWAAYAGAIAAVNADTWATELGVLNPAPPRLITNGKQVERGTSGAISLLGTLAALGGSMLVAAIAAMFSPWSTSPAASGWVIAVAATLGGLFGSLFDSLLGATVQAIYFCPVCQKETERHPLHNCGAATAQVRGWRWLGNDGVNWLCSLAGALAALALFVLLDG